MVLVLDGECWYLVVNVCSGWVVVFNGEYGLWKNLCLRIMNFGVQYWMLVLVFVGQCYLVMSVVSYWCLSIVNVSGEFWCIIADVDGIMLLESFFFFSRSNVVLENDSVS